MSDEISQLGELFPALVKMLESYQEQAEQEDS